ncbi:hypothetical protein FO519_005721 [Halicephalobus sp. NKZ332]|nr:hypothetical protein FO519_005721 [Halicephalobus sp. NKZ332]
MKLRILILSFTLLIQISYGQESTPVTVELDKKCLEDKDIGNGTEEIPRYFFEASSQNCKKFNFTGEGGNENNFETELDCLNDCFVGVESEKPESPVEEDVTFVAHDSLSSVDDCKAPKDSGTGDNPSQKFYYDDKWHACFAFKYNGKGGNKNRFDTMDECQTSCLHADGSVCTGPSGSAEMLKSGRDCDQVKCPKGYSCHRGMFPECCKDSEMEEIQLAWSETCPDTTKAAGIVDQFFQPIFGSTCEDLICEKDQKCIQVSKNFAKCCGGQKRLSDDIPVSAGALHVRIDDCDLEERRALQECENFLVEIDIARRISNSKRMFSGAASILKEFKFACAKFEEYKTCVALMTKNAGCLDRSLATKEQLLNFVCQENVREAMAKESSDCINQLSESPKIKECEDTMRRNLEDADGDLCSALDQTLIKYFSELLSCGRNTLSYVTNIVTTIKANMDDCITKHEISGDSGSFVKTIISRPSLSITEVRVGPTSVSSGRSKKGRRNGQRRIRPSARPAPSFPALKPRCPPSITRQASSTCFPMLSSRSVKQALTSKPGDFVLANFDAKNIETFCEQSSRYRGCLESLYSSDDSCLPNLKEDAFYSFIVAFEDKFCEKEKQIEWLVNSGCLKETSESLQTKRCLLRSGLGEDRTLCKTMKQMTDCVMDSIIKCVRARQIALVRDESYVPECKETGTFHPMQCDRYNGSCFCVDELTGVPLEGTSSGPGYPLPLCGLKSLFTCEKLSSKLFCEVDGTIAQKTERWYRQGDRCVMYLYDYCSHQSHIPPIPLRTKTDCERFCLLASR